MPKPITLDRSNLSLDHEHRGGNVVDSNESFRSPLIFDQIGGQKVVESLLDDLYRRLENDPKISPYFPHFENHGIKAFFIEWLGGENYYSGSAFPGPGLQQFHHSTYVTKSLAGIWLKHMQDSLAQTSIDGTLQTQIMTALKNLANALVNSSDPPQRDGLVGTCNGVHTIEFFEHDQLRAQAAKGNIEAIKEAIDKDPQAARFRGSNGCSYLWEAASKGKIELAKFLIDTGADINAPGCEPSQFNMLCGKSAKMGTAVMVTPWTVAASRGYQKLADLLMESGAVLDIFSLAYLGELELLKDVVEKNKDLVNAHDPSEDFKRITPLHHAIAGGQFETSQYLIDQGAEVKSHSAWLLTHAALANRADLIELLLKKGAEAKCSSLLGPLDSSERPVADLLVKHGYNVNNNPAYGVMLVRACRSDVSSKETNLIEVLLSYGACVNQQGHGGLTALHYAIRSGKLPAIKLLLDKGADINLEDNEGLNALLHLKKTRSKADPAPVIKLMLDSGADINTKSKNGETLLFFYAKKGNKKVVEWLLKNGADRQLKNKAGKTVYDTIKIKKDKNFDAIRNLLKG